jgi:hypothetical protein
VDRARRWRIQIEFDGKTLGRETPGSVEVGITDRANSTRLLYTSSNDIMAKTVSHLAIPGYAPYIRVEKSNRPFGFRHTGLYRQSERLKSVVVMEFKDRLLCIDSQGNEGESTRRTIVCTRSGDVHTTLVSDSEKKWPDLWNLIENAQKDNPFLVDPEFYPCVVISGIATVTIIPCVEKKTPARASAPVLAPPVPLPLKRISPYEPVSFYYGSIPFTRAAASPIF